MEQYLKEHFSRKELDDKFKSYSAASKQNEELSDESRKTYNKYLDSILLYSAGSFSFTVALIGLVIGDKAKALAHIGFFLPNIYWLYVSWILFALTCFLILVSKRFRSKYIERVAEFLCKKIKGLYGPKTELLIYFAKRARMY
jgi:hypothetical protein